MRTKSFFKLPLFAVVGASQERHKFGNKVLRAYKDNALKAIPINTKQSVIEEIPCLQSLTELATRLADTESELAGILPNQVGVSIITPPSVTKLVLQEGIQQGYSNFFLQPGTCNEEVQDYLLELKRSEPRIKVIQGCVLVELGFDENT